MGVKLTTEEVAQRIRSNFEQDVELVSKYINKRSQISLHCNDCGYDWETIANYVVCNGVHQCPNCGLHAKSIENVFHCSNCGKEIYRPNSKVKQNKSGYFYCSQQCGNEHKNKIRKDNGEWDHSNNYRRRALETYEHQCCICGWNEDERILEVHHIDENRENNDINNLCILCPTCHRKITLGYYELTTDFKLIEIA